MSPTLTAIVSDAAGNTTVGRAPFTVNAPQAATLLGTSQGGYPDLAPRAVRTYDSNAGPKPWPQTNASRVTGVASIIDSCHPAKSQPDIGWRNDPAKVAAVTTWVTTTPDVPGHRKAVTHEPEAGGQYGWEDVDDYVADQAVFSQIVRQANRNRANPIAILRILMGQSIGSHDVSPWYVGDFDEVGADIYKGQWITPWLNFAASLGKPLAVPEFGNGVLAAGATQTDAEALAFMQAQTPRLQRPDVTVVTWFDSGTRNSLDDKPQASAWWRAASQA